MISANDITAITLRRRLVPPVPGSALQPPNAEGEEGFGAPQIKAAQAGFIPALVAPGVDLPFRPGDTRECQAAAGTAGF